MGIRSYTRSREGMEYVIKHGTGFSLEVGSLEEPEITRWTSWGNGDLQQSFMLHTPEGTLVTDLVLPQQSVDSE